MILCFAYKCSYWIYNINLNIHIRNYSRILVQNDEETQYFINKQIKQWVKLGQLPTKANISIFSSSLKPSKIFNFYSTTSPFCWNITKARNYRVRYNSFDIISIFTDVILIHCLSYSIYKGFSSFSRSVSKTCTSWYILEYCFIPLPALFVFYSKGSYYSPQEFSTFKKFKKGDKLTDLRKTLKNYGYSNPKTFKPESKPKFPDTNFELLLKKHTVDLLDIK